MKENPAIAKLYELGIKCLAEVNLFRQVGSVSKAISTPLCGAALSEFQCFGSPEPCFASYLLSFGACLWQKHSDYFMGLPSCFRLSSHFFFLLVERSDIAPLKISIVLCLSTKMKQLNFPPQNTGKPTWPFWLVCCLDLFADPSSPPH